MLLIRVGLYVPHIASDLLNSISFSGTYWSCEISPENTLKGSAEY